VNKAVDHSPRPEDRRTIRILHAINLLFCRVYHHLTIISPLRIERRGAAIIVCNHISSLDPMLLQAACPKRLIVWMMASEYMDLPMLGWAFGTIGVIPVQRDGHDSGPLRAALRALAAGRVIGIFPEGEISTDGQLRSFQNGVALLAIKSKAPVYPVYQDGTHRNRTMLGAYADPANAFITFGSPVEIIYGNSSKENIDQTAAAIQNAVSQLGQQVHDYMQRVKHI
jgi:1-acyl-sn-glycerol-3-phosphate acyltransferase